MRSRPSVPQIETELVEIPAPQEPTYTNDAPQPVSPNPTPLANVHQVEPASEIIDCGQEVDTPDFGALERNTIYDFFITRDPQQQTRTQRSMAVLAAGADEIDTRFAGSDIGGVVVDRFLRELRATAIDLARTGNVEVRRLRDQMHANDSTYQQQQRAFNPR